MRISVRTIDGKAINLEVKSDDTIRTVKKELQKEVKIRTDLQRLIFSNQALENNRTLSHYKIVDESVLYIMQRAAESSITVAGGYGQGNDINELCFPYGIVFDENQTMIIVDWGNHRIVQWKIGDVNGQVIAGGNGQGNELNQLNCPTDLLIDKNDKSLIICDCGNRRIVRWSRQADTTKGEILFDNIACWGLAMDHQRYLYVSDNENDEVRRYQIGDKNGTVVAGGNGRGTIFNQLNGPTYIFVDQQQNIYISDTWNHRVMKWNKGATEGTVVINRIFPRGLYVDPSETIFVADYGSHRLMSWPKAAKEGTIIAGGNHGGEDANQLYYPWALSLDQNGNIYVADHSNHRVQRFPIKKAN